MRWLGCATLVLTFAACATLGEQINDNGGANLPSAGDGPFRPLTAAELAPVAVVPYVFGSPSANYRDPSVVGVNANPTSAEVWMYAVADVGGTAAIVRTDADDARSFYADEADNADTSHPQHTPPVVLSANQPWEGASLSGPSALQSGGQVWLYYAGAGGIGLARSSDGLTFTKVTTPVLVPDATATWESTTPHAPSVAIFPDGSWHMLYGAGNAIGEATSADGMTWTRSAANPVLSPSPVVDPSTLAPGVEPPFDEGGVDDPVLAPQTALDGQLQVRVLYTGYLNPPSVKVRTSSIGLAGRYGDAGPLSRQAAPTYTVGLHERQPAFFEYSGGSLLYVAEDDTALSATNPFTGIAAAYSPVSQTLPPPLPFPSMP